MPLGGFQAALWCLRIAHNGGYVISKWVCLQMWFSYPRLQQVVKNGKTGDFHFAKTAHCAIIIYIPLPFCHRVDLWIFADAPAEQVS